MCSKRKSFFANVASLVVDAVALVVVCSLASIVFGFMLGITLGVAQRVLTYF